MKSFLMSILLCLPIVAHADNDTILSSKAINLISDIHNWFSDDSLYINVAHASTVDAENKQFCTATNNSSCQSFAGMSAIQTGVSGHDNFYHRVVTVVEGNGGVASYASQTGSVSHGENAQNCAAASCVMISGSK